MNQTAVNPQKKTNITEQKTAWENNLPLRYNLTNGLSEADAGKSRELYGSNAFTEKKRVGFFRKFLMNLNDPIIRILIAAMLINILFMFSDINWFETVGIGMTVLISALVSTISEHSGGAAFDKLYRQLGDKQYTVIRDGKEHTLPLSEVVTFDLVRLFPGDVIPADGFLIRGSITVDESPLTGESRNVKKTQDSEITRKLRTSPLPFRYKPSSGESFTLFRGASVVSGEAVMLAACVGDSTFYGAVAAELQTEEAPSPLKMRLTSLAGTISKIGYVSAVIIALIHLFDAFFLDSGMNLAIAAERLKDTRFVASECLSAVTMAISVIVVAVPEGLPMMITVVLSSNMKKMMKNNVLVKRPVGIETAGSLSVLFTDKTGTLTTGDLTVEEVITSEKSYTSLSEIKKTPFDYDLVVKGDQCCVSGKGNATDLAVRRFLGQVDSSEWKAEDRIPFDSALKYAAAIADGEYFIIRGAPEYLLPCCNGCLGVTGNFLPMNDVTKNRISSCLLSSAQKSCRIILQAVGKKGDFEKLKKKGLKDIPLTFHSLFILSDEIRKGVPEAVTECRHAGMKVIMMTGDNEITAASIGVKTGILSSKYAFFESRKGVEAYRKKECGLVMTGGQLSELTDDEVVTLLPRLAVIARVTPTDKSRLVKLAQAAGNVVGMTGDGINDAPALKAADVGFAMGSGTDVAKEAGDIVITDNHFVSITKAVLFGRTIFESIRKFIVFQLTMNLSAVGVSLLGPLFGVEHPVTVIQMLWVNIIMDTLGSLAFAGEPALPETMNKPPIPRSAPILTGFMVRQIICSGIYTIGLCMAFLISPDIHWLFGRGDLTYFLTVFFALFIFCGIFTAFNTRTPRINILANLWKNKAFLIIMPAVALIQLMIIYFGGDVFRTVPLEFAELCLTAAFSFTIVPVDMVRKLFSRKSNKNA